MTIWLGTFIAAATCMSTVSTLRNALHRFINAAVCRRFWVLTSSVKSRFACASTTGWSLISSGPPKSRMRMSGRFWFNRRTSPA